jgi:solute carrier family 25 aspartate/glutamate transporter 12/13
MATVKEQVKESLIGTTREPQLSFQTRATFDRHARRDEETGDPYMTVDDFVNAIAPKNEDYVSSAGQIQGHQIEADSTVILAQDST